MASEARKNGMASPKRVGEQETDPFHHCFLSGSNHKYGCEYGTDTGCPTRGKRQTDDETSHITGRFTAYGKSFLSQKEVDGEYTGKMNTEQDNHHTANLADRPHVFLKKHPDIGRRCSQQNEYGREPGNKQQRMNNRLLPDLVSGVRFLKVRKGKTRDIRNIRGNKRQNTGRQEGQESRHKCTYNADMIRLHWLSCSALDLVEPVQRNDVTGQ